MSSGIVVGCLIAGVEKLVMMIWLREVMALCDCDRIGLELHGGAGFVGCEEEWSHGGSVI